MTSRAPPTYHPETAVSAAALEDCLGATSGDGALAQEFPEARRRAPSAGSAGGPRRILIIEDSPAYASLVEQMLHDTLGTEIEVLHRHAVSGARPALVEQPIDCVLLDLSLPDASGLEALKAVEAIAPQVPVVVLTGTDDEALAVQAVHEGAQDYLSKRSADAELLARAVRYAIERKRAEVSLAHQALHDPLTMLPNRVLFLERLNMALARSGRRQMSLAVLFLDLDRFKTINDSLGHEAGDELLVELAQRLPRVLRPGDTVARFGGDEFLILCEDLHGERGVMHVAERVRAAIAEPVKLGSHEISVGATVGIAWAKPAGSSAATLIGEADVAMYRAKQSGGGIGLFEARMHAQAMTELETEHELRHALERGELSLHYQPQIALTDGHAFALEALLRWQHPERGLLMPSAFIALAEETGLIVPIGEWVISEACRRLAGWQRERCVPADLTVSVNLSPRQLGFPGLADSVAQALAASKLPPSALCLEVTETSVARDPIRAGAVLRDLKELGVRLALDDFGTGQSSLSALTGYPLDTVKIDRSFLDEVDGDAASARMFGAILGVVRAAELQSVAEGVEQEQQLDFLRRFGCDGAQGFIFGRPAPGDAIVAQLAATTGGTGG